MSIAICISGQSRFVEKGFEYFQRNLPNADVAVFAHTWYDPHLEDCNLEYNWNSTNLQKYKIQNIDFIIQNYKPVSLLVETPRTFFNFLEKTKENNYCSQFYSIKKANDLRADYERAHNMKFKWVVRMRFDWAWNMHINFDDLDNSVVHIVDTHQTINNNPSNRHINDQFAIGNSDDLNNYCKTFDIVESYISEQGILDGLEKILYETLLKYNVRIQQLNWSHPFPANPSYALGCPSSLIRY